MPDKPNCHKCIYRRNIPGDAHSCCVHPETGLDKSSFPEFDGLLATLGMGKGANAVITLGIKAHPHGVRSGWFMWPSNFDPTWLLECNGFKEKKETQNAGTGEG